MYEYEIDFFLIDGDDFEQLIIEKKTHFWIPVKKLKIAEAKKSFYGLSYFFPKFIKEKKIKEATKRIKDWAENNPELFL